MRLEKGDQERLTEAVVHQILVIEDDDATGQFLKTLLEQHGYKVTLARDGGQAHSSFVMRKPDFVILDAILPEQSGFEICERFKQLEKGVPVLMLSAIELEDARSLAQRVGVDKYVNKPFDPVELLSCISQVADEVWAKHHSDPVKESAIRFSCKNCGKKFKVSRVHRGKSINCPECGETVPVPLA